MRVVNNVLRQHQAKNIVLMVLSLVFMPIDTMIALAALVSSQVVSSSEIRRRHAIRETPGFTPKTILVTGVGMSKGLCLARVFYEAGHDVVGADFESLVCGRVSRSLARFCRLQGPTSRLGSAPYVESLLDIVLSEDVDLWVSCSGVASAIADGEAKEIIEARTACTAIQFDVKTTQMLHEKDSFIKHTDRLGLNVPETHTITSYKVAQAALENAPSGRKYIMKPIGVDDASRGDMTLLPKLTTEGTVEHLSKLKISEDSPWILQQFIEGPEYCTHSLVVKGEVKAFVACPSAELLMHYEALPSDSKLSQAMLKFTEVYAANGGLNFTGHLSFDFMVDRHQMDGLHRIREDEEPVLYPIECNPRAHTAVVLFSETPDLSNAYMSALNPLVRWEAAGLEPSHPSAWLKPYYNDKYFWIGHDLVELLMQPLLSLLLFQASISMTQLIRNAKTLLVHMFSWRDGTFAWWDPLPWWVLYHVYWPVQFWNALRTGNQWSRINVSTTKKFAC